MARLPRPVIPRDDHQSRASQVSADGRAEVTTPVVVLEVPGDGVGAGVQAAVTEFPAQSEDQVAHLDGQRPGVRRPWVVVSGVRRQPRLPPGTRP